MSCLQNRTLSSVSVQVENALHTQCMCAGNFQGVKFSQASSDLDSVLQIVGLYGLEIYNSVFDGLPASLRIASSSVQLTNSNFTNIQGNTAGGLIIDQAVVDINACKFSDSQSQSGRPILQTLHLLQYV